jgi:hypothetical protein
VQTLITCYAVGHPAELDDLREKLAKRLMTAARIGVHDADILKAIGLTGLVPPCWHSSNPLHSANS